MWEEREKRDDMDIGDADIEEALRGYASREKRAVDKDLTPAQKACIKGNCPVCTPFLSATTPGADLIDIWRVSKFFFPVSTHCINKDKTAAVVCCT